MSRKKVIIFVVEGISDEAALAPLIDQLIDDRQFRYLVIDGDITSDKSVNITNIKNKLFEKIRIYLKQQKLLVDDVQSIIHLVDSDGVYIDDDLVKQDSLDKIFYDEDCMRTNFVQRTIDRNDRKRQILDRLILEKKYTPKSNNKKSKLEIAYEIYYCSCNLDHVLYNERNLAGELKYEKADEFSDRYEDDVEDFIEFMNSDEIKTKDEYYASWKYLKKDMNSLKRGSNLNLYINKLIEK